MVRITTDKIKGRIITYLSKDTGDYSSHERIVFESNDKLLSYLLDIKNNEVFITNVYQAILDRLPDPEGHGHYLAKLSRGWPKAFILSDIANSGEARISKNGIRLSVFTIYLFIVREKVKHAGFKHAESIKKIPVLGGIATYIYRSMSRDMIKSRRPLAGGKRSLLLSIPVISPLLVWAYSLIKMPLNVRDSLAENRSLKVDVQRLSEENRALRGDLQALAQANQGLKSDIDALSNAVRTIGDDTGRLGGIGSDVQSLGAEVRGFNAKSDARLNNYTEIFLSKYTELSRSLRDRSVISTGNNVIMTVEGFIMVLPGEDYKLTSYLAFYGKLEQGLVEVFRKSVTEGMVVVDVGANVGIYTLLSAGGVGKSGRVYSFEPTPRTFDLLKRNIDVNGFTDRVKASMMAVMDKRSIMEFSIYDENTSHNTLFPEEGDASRVKVNTINLDEALAAEPRIDIIKIDAEGAEPFVLKGMADIIRKNPDITIFMEFAPKHLRRAGVDVADFIDVLSNYNIQKVDDMTGEFLSVTPEELINCHSINLVMRPGKGKVC